MIASLVALQLIRVAIISLSGDLGDQVADQLRSSFDSEQRIALVDKDQSAAAAAGVGYGGSINLAKTDARRIGSAIGCDFFIVGVAQTTSRSVRTGESHIEAAIALMVVDGRTGTLAQFDFISENGANRAEAAGAAIKTLNARTAGYTNRLVDYQTSRLSATAEAAIEIFEDLPDSDSPRMEGFQPPKFLNRAKPDYTDEADRFGITASVDALVMFRATGEIGAIEITRWAGFGLEESAIRAIKQLKFSPAERDGKPIGVRALVQYNFRRHSSDSVPALKQSSPDEKKVPDLKELFKPRYVRPRSFFPIRVLPQAGSDELFGGN